MKLKWLFGAGLLGIVVFFSAIYLGMKYNWVSESRPATPKVVQTKKQQLHSVNKADNKTPAISSSNLSGTEGNGVDPQLIDEIDTTVEEKILGSTDLTIEEVVAECQSLSNAIGIPDSRLEHAIGECVDRNSRHLVSNDGQSTDERDKLIREQCNAAITQKDLLSSDEIKMLVDECVASMSIN